VISSSQLILTALPGIPLIKEGDDLPGLIRDGLARASIDLQDNDLIAVAQKIISKAEGRLIDLRSVRPSSKAEQIAEETEKDPRLVELILKESSRILRLRKKLIIVEHRLGFVCANAGIDLSNVRELDESNPLAGEHPEFVLLLPEDPDKSAHTLRDGIRRFAQVNVGVLIIDSHGRPFREGSIGVAIGIAGLPGLLDLRGGLDLFGKTLQTTQVGIADELASAASVLMGQAAEKQPVVHIRGFPHALRESSIKELIRIKERDLFRQ